MPGKNTNGQENPKSSQSSTLISAFKHRQPIAPRPLRAVSLEVDQLIRNWISHRAPRLCVAIPEGGFAMIGIALANVIAFLALMMVCSGVLGFFHLLRQVPPSKF